MVKGCAESVGPSAKPGVAQKSDSGGAQTNTKVPHKERQGMVACDRSEGDRPVEEDDVVVRGGHIECIDGGLCRSRRFHLVRSRGHRRGKWRGGRLTSKFYALLLPFFVLMILSFWNCRGVGHRIGPFHV